MGVATHARGDRLNIVEGRSIQVLLIRQLRQFYRLATQFRFVVSVKWVRMGFPLGRIADIHHVFCTSFDLAKIFGNQAGHYSLRAGQLGQHQSRKVYLLLVIARPVPG